MAAIAFTSNGTWNWPVGVTTATLECIGAGGAGGNALGTDSTGGGGKGGGYARYQISKGSESFLSVVVGLTSQAPSSVSQNSVIKCQAAGGYAGGTGSSSPSSGLGATEQTGAMIGDVLFFGGNGGQGSHFETRSGGGGGAGGPAGHGASATRSGPDLAFWVGGAAGAGGTLGGGTINAAASPGRDGVLQDQSGAPGNTSTSNFGGAGSGGNTTTSTDRFGGAAGPGIVVISWTAPPFVEDQTSYRFYVNDATTEANATPLAPQDTDVTVDVTDGNAIVLLRIRMQEAGVGQGDPDDDYYLYASKSGGVYTWEGAASWYDILTPTGLVGGTPTTNLLGFGSGPFIPGEVSFNVIDNWNIPGGGGGFTEFLFGIRLIKAQLLHNDTLDFHIFQNAVTSPFYSVTPRITVLKRGAMPQKIVNVGQAIPRSRFY